MYNYTVNRTDTNWKVEVGILPLQVHWGWGHTVSLIPLTSWLDYVAAQHQQQQCSWKGISEYYNHKESACSIVSKTCKAQSEIPMLEEWTEDTEQKVKAT